MMKIGIIMGSDSDWPTLEPAVKVIEEFGLEAEVLVASAHRTPNKVHQFVSTAEERGIKVIIAAAGAAAHLPGVVASFTTLPVVGVPVNSTPLAGIDALLSIVQMPAGIPVGTMAINGAKNAAIYAMQIIGCQNAEIAEKLKKQREAMAAEVEAKAERLNTLRKG